ncbi:FHA domain-containing protein [Pseudonocardia sp. WMMC193]|uniref:FHA domain-containing protein n=1 Tax=Pseudonocardia sp. WMMC193 TaxID=2911965 RepID=UPI001F0088E9|nr:FHA domain-containing protein [Pseudonocardia sp. WMMC193]MCF7553459.1 FHA domain-containing protein [Pseudonocardia sp. WMMC193]
MPDVRILVAITDLVGGRTAERTVLLPVVLGRQDGAGTLTLPDPEVSRSHARLELVEGEVVVTDLGSSNGTRVNGEVVTRHAVAPTDVLRLGRFELRWRAPGAQRDAVTFVGTAPAPARPTVSPARVVVATAERTNRVQGHELDGFLSTEFGLLPAAPPLLSLPASHAAWDEVAAELPRRYGGLHLRRLLENLPELDTSPDALPDDALYRASTILGTFAHAYQYLTTDPPSALPPAVLRPWTAVSTRLGKELPSMSYTDLFLYNWRLRDPAGPRALDNMELLVPNWGNGAERIFYLVTTEFAMSLTPVLAAMVDAQDAVLREDETEVGEALLRVLDGLRAATQVIYPQLDPNPRGRHFLDQVVWAKTVGTAGVPVVDGAPSPSGTAQPHVHAIDAFLERAEYGSLVGRQSTYLAGHFPRHWTEFVAALREVSVRTFVEQRGRADLRGLYNAVLDAYLGDRGWMGLHRIKAYGFLEVAFKVGRQVTTGARFTGLFKDRTWDAVDGELALVREERRPPVGRPVVFGRPVRGRLVADAEGGGWTCHLQLDVSGQGVYHLPGDRLGVLPENDDDLVERTLRALQATGDELVPLTERWRQAVRLRAGFSDDVDVLPLRTLLRFARIRPMDRPVAKRLLALSASGALGRVVDARMEDQWELWDVLNLLHAGGFDVTRLWAGHVEESLAALVPPETFRLYSLAGATAPGEPAETLSLVVRGLGYTSARSAFSTARERRGTASHFLRRMATDPRHRNKRLSLRIVPAPRFRLPDGPDTPMLMFAAGSGVAPFHGLVAARGERPAVLYVGARTAGDLDLADFDAAAARGGFTLHTALSREDATLMFDGTAHAPSAGTRARVPDLVAAHDPWDLLRTARVYVCGRTDFAVSVIEALKEVARPRTDPDEFVRRLVAEDRLQLDVFTTYGGHAQQGRMLEVSELVRHPATAATPWMAVSGKVYDMTEFVHLHVGGPHIVLNNCGLDGTDAYQRVLHHAHAEIDAQLGMYELGTLRRLRFGGRWGVVPTAEGLRFLSLDDLFTTWVRTIYLVVGMQNALVADVGFADRAATGPDDPGELTPYKAQFLVEGHRRFLVSYLDGLLDDDLRTLWRLTAGYCADDVDLRTADRTLAALAETAGYRQVRGIAAHLKDLVGQVERGGRAPSALVPACRLLAAEDVRLLSEITLALREGILAFEEHEEAVREAAGARLVAAVDAAFTAVTGYYARLATGLAELGIVVPEGLPDVADDPVPEDGGLPGHGGALDR